MGKQEQKERANERRAAVSTVLEGNALISKQLAALRKRAEKRLKAQPKGSARPSKGTDHLTHELQVYQIELEIQNEDLRRAQRELENTRNNYGELYDFAPVGYFTL